MGILCVSFTIPKHFRALSLDKGLDFLSPGYPYVKWCYLTQLLYGFSFEFRVFGQHKRLTKIKLVNSCGSNGDVIVRLLYKCLCLKITTSFWREYFSK